MLGFLRRKGLQSRIYKYTRVPNGMNIENLTEEELKDLIFKKQLEWIKLCQDDFLIFATETFASSTVANLSPLMVPFGFSSVYKSE